jgi:hypothetical protein
MPRTPEEIADRVHKFRSLEKRGLLVRHAVGNGEFALDFPQPDHPDVLAFLEPLGELPPGFRPGIDAQSVAVIDGNAPMPTPEEVERHTRELAQKMRARMAAAARVEMFNEDGETAESVSKALLAKIAEGEPETTKTWLELCAQPDRMQFVLFILASGGLAVERKPVQGLPTFEIVDYGHRAVVLFIENAVEHAKAHKAIIIDPAGAQYDFSEDPRNVPTRH